MRSVDTNVLVRLVVGDEPIQTKHAEAFVSGGGWVSHLVLAETTWVLQSNYDLTSSKIGDTVKMLLAHESLTIQDAEVVSAALESYQKRPSLGFSDCLILEIARKAGHVPLGTFDRSLAKLDGVEKI